MDHPRKFRSSKRETAKRSKRRAKVQVFKRESTKCGKGRAKVQVFHRKIGCLRRERRARARDIGSLWEIGPLGAMPVAMRCCSSNWRSSDTFSRKGVFSICMILKQLIRLKIKYLNKRFREGTLTVDTGFTLAVRRGNVDR